MDKSRRTFIANCGLASAGISLGYHQAFGRVDQKVKIAVIGTGSRGSGLASELAKNPRFSLDACCDIDPEHLENGMRYASKGAKRYTDYRALLDDSNIEAVVIASPLYLHHPMVIDAIDAGKHIYCEKTLALTTAQSLDIAERAKDSQMVFQVGFQYRYYPLYDAVYEGIKNGDIGDVKHFICHYNRNSDWRREVNDPSREREINWRMYREYSGGVMAELSAHEIDVINRMFDGPPNKVTGFGSINTFDDGREIFDNVNLIFNYPGNITGTVTCHLSNQHQPYIIKIMGTRGTVEIDRTTATFYAEPGAVKESDKGIVDGVSGATMKVDGDNGWLIPVEMNEGWSATSYAFDGFADSIIDGAPVRSSVETGKDSSIAVDMGNLAMQHERIEWWKEGYN